MASGHVNRTYRPNTWQHRPSLRREVFSCQPGAVHTWHKTEVAVATVEDGIVDLYGVFSCGRLLNERADSPDMLAMGQDVILGASALLDDRASHPACRTGALAHGIFSSMPILEVTSPGI